MKQSRTMTSRPLARPLGGVLVRQGRSSAAGGRTYYRTNLCLQSETFDNATWTKTDVTVTADSTAAPNGATTADTLTEGTAGTATTVQNVTGLVASTFYTWSVYLKRSNGQWVKLWIGNGGNQIMGWFDIQNGVAGAGGVAGTGVVRTPVIQAVGNGWYRCSVAGNLGSPTDADFHIISASANSSDTRVNNDARFAWGAQVEKGAEPTRYIPTIAAAQTE